MYTGYYAQLKKYLADGLYPVSIAGKCPDWYHGAEYKKLAPKWSFFSEWKNGSHKGDAGCDATPEEIKLVKNIIKQIKTNEKTKGFTWNYGIR